MIEIFGFLIILLFVLVCLYGREPHISFPKGYSSIQWAGCDKFYVGMPTSLKCDYIGSGSQWKEVPKSLLAETKCACHFIMDGEPVIVVGRTDGIYIVDKALNSAQIYFGKIWPTSISISNYFGDGTPTIYVSAVNGNNLFLVREKGEWLELAEKYQCHMPENCGCALFVDLKNRGVPDIVCATEKGLFVFPNGAKKIVPFIQLKVGDIEKFRVADFNNTGRQSFLIMSPAMTGIIYNIGDYEFSPINVIGSFGMCDICDLNNNGHIDIIGSDSVMNRGNNNFVSRNELNVSGCNVKIICVGGIESVLRHDVRRNKLANKKCRKIGRKCDMDSANVSITCQYDDGKILTVQNIISSEYQLPYHKFGYRCSPIKSLTMV